MTILALDCATKTGWAISHNGEVISGVRDLALLRGESVGMRFVKFRKFLTEMLEAYPITVVIYEQAHHRGGAATEVGVGLSTRVLELCHERKIETTTVHTATLKKWACGHGKADKSAMIEKAMALGFKPKDDNEADAILMLHYAIETYKA